MQLFRSGLLALLCATVAAAQSARPTLVARCVNALDQSDEAQGSIAEIAVENKGAVPLEPMEFALTLVSKAKDAAPRQVRCARISGPWTGRGGRPTLPKSKRSYWVLCPFPAERARGAEVEVTVECDSAREEALEDPVQVLDKRFGIAFVSTANRELPSTILSLSNRSARELDAVFRVTCDEPAKRIGLATVRLKPNEARDWTVDEIALHTGALDGAKLSRVELVDWCVVRSGAGDARRTLDQLFARWQRWPARVPLLEASCKVALHGASEKTVEGSVRISADGTAEVRVAFDEFGRDGPRIARLVSLPFLLQNASRLESELFSRALDVGEIDHDRVVRFDPPIELGALKIGALAYDDRRFLWHSEDAAATAMNGRTVWRTRQGDSGWTLEGFDLVQLGSAQPQVEQRFEFAPIAGVAMPVRVDAMVYGDQLVRREEIEARFEDWRVPKSAKGLPAPSGPLADQLRAAWNAPYAYPEHAVRLSGSFDLRTTVDDPDWLGKRRVIGQFDLSEFQRGRWAQARIDVTSGELSDDDRRALASSLEDRLRAWFAHDFAARAPFDLAFSGAKLTGASPSFALADCELEALTIADDLPAVLRYADGEARTLTYKKIEGLAPIVEEAASDRGRYHAEYFALTPEWRLPRSIEIRGTGHGHGDETLALNNLKVSGVNR